jgi:hypothetical protein
MINHFLLFAGLFFSIQVAAQTSNGLGQKIVQIDLPINTVVNQNALITTVNNHLLEPNQMGKLGILTNQAKLYLNFTNKNNKVVFEVSNSSKLLTTGLQTKVSFSKKIVTWDLNSINEKQYKLYIATANDSTQNYIFYSGYIYFPSLNKWKLIASFRINKYTEGLKFASAFKSNNINANMESLFTDTWSQGDNGAWLKIQNTSIQKPFLPPFSDIDSLARAYNDSIVIKKLIESNKTDAINYKNGLYYTMMKTGTKPELVKLTDTVSIFYKGYLMGTNIIFDQTAKETRTFPLARLIKGWQVGLEGARIGDKVKLLIPSGLAYSIRTRSAIIVPNSVLVFEIEMVNAKPSQFLIMHFCILHTYKQMILEMFPVTG